MILYTVRHYHARRQLFAMKVKQYTLLTGPHADRSDVKHKAASLARDAVEFDGRWSKYLHFVPAL